MRQTEITLKKLEPSADGLTIVSKDRKILTKLLYLGINDSPDNYEEITDEEAEVIRQEQEEERLRQEELNNLENGNI